MNNKLYENKLSRKYTMHGPASATPRLISRILCCGGIPVRNGVCPICGERYHEKIEGKDRFEVRQRDDASPVYAVCYEGDGLMTDDF